MTPKEPDSSFEDPRPKKRKTLVRGLAYGLAAVVLAAVAAQAFPPDVIPDELVLSDDVVSEAFTPSARATAALRSGAARVTLDEFPVAPGFRVPLELERYPVYAPGARVWVVDSDGQLRPGPRTRRIHYLGTSPEDRSVRVGLSVDPASGHLRGLAAGPTGVYEILEPEPGDASRHRVAPPRGDVDPLLASDCGSDHLPIPASVDAMMAQTPLKALAAASSEPTHAAIVAVDTDNELNHLKFGNDTSAASDWIADLFTAMNVYTERDLSLRLLQGDTFLRRDTDPSPTYDDDPYAITGSPAGSAHLGEFGAYWQLNMGSVERVFAMLLSGKSGSSYSASGIAWLDGYCESQSSGGGYSVTQVFKANIPISNDARLVAHELAHNMGSPHTHCYSPPVDHCYALQGGCYSGPTSCPPEGQGTIMSYCHFSSGAACGPSRGEFHPTVAALIGGFVDSHAPSCVEELSADLPIFSDGFESGDASAWSG